MTINLYTYFDVLPNILKHM